MAEIKSIEEEESVLSGKNKKDFKFSLPLRERDPNTAPPTAAVHANGNRRHAAPGPIIIPDDHAHTNEHESGDENDEHSPSSATTTTPSTTSSTTTPRLTKADTRAAKRAAKSAKSQRKSLKNQTKLACTVSVKASDVEHIASVLHGSTFSIDSTSNNAADAEEGARHPLASDKNIEDVIERNRRYLGHIREHRAYLLREVGGQRKKECRERVKKQQAQQKDYRMGRARRGFHEDEEDEESKVAEEEEQVVDAILTKLGITITANSLAASSADRHPTTPNKRHSVSSTSGTSSSHTHTKQTVIAQLRTAIAEDLQKHENEQRHTLIRAGGFWRYVGRQVFERMCVIGEKIDWRTGMIKKAAEEGKSEDVVGEGDGDVAEVAYAVGENAAGHPDGGEGQKATPVKEQEHDPEKKDGAKTDDPIATTHDWNVVDRTNRRLRRAGRVVYPTINQQARDALLHEESH